MFHAWYASAIFMTRIRIQVNGKVDLSYFAMDCFHVSAKGQASLAVALWNNMV